VRAGFLVCERLLCFAELSNLSSQPCTVIERLGAGASLCGSSAGGHVCILVKAVGDGSYSIDGKATSAPLLALLMDELKQLLA
jgi:hypothetical protein